MSVGRWTSVVLPKASENLVHQEASETHNMRNLFCVTCIKAIPKDLSLQKMDFHHFYFHYLDQIQMEEMLLPAVCSLRKDMQCMGDEYVPFTLED